MKQSICLDTHILIWGIKEEATTGQEPMVEKAKIFLSHVEKDSEITIIVPAVVLAEVLMKVPADLHKMIANSFHKVYEIASFDAKAASLFARIWQDKKNKKAIDELLAKNATKNELKADCLIVATAVAREASCLYSHDSGVKKFGEGYIDVCEIPTIQGQIALMI